MSADWQFWVTALAVPVPWLGNAPLGLVVVVLLALILAVGAWRPNHHPMARMRRMGSQESPEGFYARFEEKP